MIPYFPQETEYTCGAASMRMVLAGFGVQESEEDLAEKMKTNSRHGVLFKDMIAFVRSMKFRFRNGQHLSYSNLNSLLQDGWQVVICYYLLREKSDHFAVVRKISKGRIYLADPAFGKNHSFSLRHFARIWKTVKKPDISVRWFLAINN